PDSKAIAFTVTADDRITLWAADPATGAARQLSPAAINAAAPGAPCTWLPDSKRLACRVVPADRGALPPEAGTPDGPIIQESDGKKAPVWTFQDLLQNPRD